MDDRARLPLCDLAPLAVFLCGARWQTALARLVRRDPRLIRRYVAGGAPISAAVSGTSCSWSARSTTTSCAGSKPAISTWSAASAPRRFALASWRWMPGRSRPPPARRRRDVVAWMPKNAFVSAEGAVVPQAHQPAHRTGGDRACARALQQGNANKKDAIRQDPDDGDTGGRSSAAKGASAHYDRKTSWRQTELAEPKRSGPCPGNRQDAAGNHRRMQRCSPKPCRRGDCAAQARWPH